MNKIYKVIWSNVRNCYVAVSEIAKRNGKSCTSVNCGAKANRGHAGVALSAAVGATLLAGVCSVLLPVRVALAAPELLTLPTLDVNGKSAAVTIASTSSATSATMNINSTQTNNVLKWIDFSIGQGGTVNFTDTNHYLNYVTGHGRSEIYGTLTGKTGSNIYLVNPNGILIGNGAVVNVGNLYLSTRELGADQFSEFLADNNPLTSGAIKGDVVNLGKLNANNITVEGNNITFKNTADVKNADGSAVNTNVTLTANGGEIHIGSVDASTPAGYTMTATAATGEDSKIYMYKLVSTPEQLQAIGEGTNLSGNYMLANDIDLKNGDTFFPFKPIGYTKKHATGKQDLVFTGRFDGLNYKIKNLKITNDTLLSLKTDDDEVDHNIGLFGINSGTIENIGVEDTEIEVSKDTVGGIAGWNNDGGIIRNVYHTGNVTGRASVGGIAGANQNGSLIEAAYNTGEVTGTFNVGGIAGINAGGASTGNVSRIKNVYNTGAVTGTTGTSGGIAGNTTHNIKIENAYNTGAIKSGDNKSGGIVGNVYFENTYGTETATIMNTYNTGTVTNVDNTIGGGIIGFKYDNGILDVNLSYYLEGTGTGNNSITTEQLKRLNTFSGWSISATGGDKTTWRISEGQTTPILTAFLKTKDYINKKAYDGAANVGTTKSVTTHQKEGLEAGFDYVQDVSVIEPKELLLVANKVSIKKGGDVPPLTGRITGFVGEEGLGTGDTLTFALAGSTTPTMAGSYAVTGKLNDAESGTYGTNYTFRNAESNASAFSIVLDVMPKLDFKGASPYVTIASTPNTMDISSTQTNNVLKWMDFSIDKDGTVGFDNHNYLNYVTGHGRSEIDGTLTGGGNIYLINPNGMVFGSNASVNVGNLYLSTRSIDETTLNSFDNNNTTAMNPLSSAAASATGDIVNLGTLTAANIIAEGNNISFKNVEDVSVTGTGKINVRASGEVHVGYIDSDSDYATVREPDLENWNFTILDNTTDVTPTKYMLVRNASELQNMQSNLTGNYMLANDIDFNDDPNFATGFKPIGYKDNSSSDGVRHSFSGKFDGLNYEIKNLKITDASLSNTTDLSLDVKEHVGLFGDNIGTIENVGVVGTDINVSKGVTGGIVGYNNGGTIRNVYHTGSVLSSNLKVGGIAGANTGVIEKAYNTGTVDGTVVGNGQIGGIVGTDTGGTIREVYNASDVGYINTTSSALGGIVGYANRATTVEDAYNSGSITGRSQAGGIIGFVNSSSGDVKSKIKRSYNTGNVMQGEGNGGGIVGRAVLPSDVQVESSFFSKGVGNNYGGEYKTEAELKQLSTFSGWKDNDNVPTISATGGAKTTWRIYEGQTTPLLTAFLKTKDVITETEYNGTEQSFDENLVTGDSHIIPTDVGGYAKQTDAGKYNGLTEGKVLYSDQLGYDLVDTKLIIQPKRVSLVNADKTYDGTKDVNTSTLNLNTADIIGSDSAKVTLVNNNVTGTYADKNAGDGKAITYTIADGALIGTAAGNSAGNYIISPVGTGNITAKTLNLANVSKEYDGTANVEAGDIGITETDIVTNDINKVTFDSSKVTGSYADKNVGTSKGVTYTVNAGALTGAEAGNYVISTAGTGEITPRTVTLDKKISKVYDRTNTATPTVDALSNVVEADKEALSISATSATYSDVNVGDDLTVTYEGLQLGGTKAGNYSLEATDATVLNNSITQRPVTLTGKISKVYDGTTAAIPSAHTLENVIDEDLEDLDLLATSASFDNKNVGENNRTITYKGLTLSGEKAPNYRLTNTSATIGGNTIIPKELALVADKVRIKKGGTPPTTFTGNLTGFVPGEELNQADRSKLSFTASVLDTTTAGSYAITGTFNGQESGTYRINDSEPYNYTFKNAISNATAFTVFTDMMPKLDLRGGDIKAASPYVTIDDTTANTMVISSTQDNNVLKWIDFSIDSGGTVKYDAKNYLNFVTGHGRSEIYGTLTGDGNIYLINPNGILFGSDAQVDVGNLYLSTRNLTTTQLADYTTGVAALYKNDNAAVGDIINLGRLDADLIKAEGRNISFKNIADVTKGGTLTDGVITGGTAHNEAANGSVTLTVNNVEADPDHNVKENKGEIHLGFAVSNTPADRVNSTQYTNVTAPTLARWTANVTPTMYMLVRNEYELQNMNNNLTKVNAGYMPGNYMLANDIDASLFKFMPVGSVNGGGPEDPGVFKGKFDGLYHVIKDITIDKTSVRSSTYTDIGIIGSNAGTVENLGVVNGTVDATGISNNSAIGGIVGANKTGAVIRNVYFSGSVKGLRAVGGIAGWQNSAYNSYPHGIIENAYSTGTVSGSTANANTNSINPIVGQIGGIIREAYGRTSDDRYDIYDSNSTRTLNVTASAMKNVQTFTAKGWTDVSTDGTGSATWRIYEGQTMPLLTAFLRTKALVTETEYNGSDSEQSFDASITTGDNHIIAVSASENCTAKGTNAGVYGETKKFYSDQQGYNIVDTELVIQPKRLTLVNSKTYDGTTNTNTNSTTDLAGIIGNDAVTLVDGKVTGIYADKNVGKNKPVIYTTIADDALDGTSAVNYILTAKGIGTISPRGISVAFGAISKTYDGLTTSDTIGARTFTNVIAADAGQIDVTATATYDKKDVGDRNVAYTDVTLTGTEAGNYSIADTGTGKGTISKREISVAFGDISKTYDGLTTSDTIGKRTFTNVVDADAEKVDVTATATYDKKDAGDRSVAYTGVTLTGAEAGNYSISDTGTGAGTITQREISVAFGDISKTYDGLTTSDTIGKRTFTNVVDADAEKVDVTATATYDKKDAGNRSVAYSGVTLTGAEAGNYSIADTGTGKGTISKREISVAFGDISKTYDGLTTSDTIGKRTFTNVVDADAEKVDVTATATYDKKDAGDRSVAYSGVTLTGAEAGNYSIADTGTGAGTITQREISVAFGDISKTYDGLTTSDTIGARTFTNVIAADADKVDVTATATYDEKNVGSRTVDYSAIALTGDEANNYSLANTTASSTGTINKRETGVSFGAISKTYDGLTTSDTIGARTFTNVIAADADKVDVTATATYDEKNAGNRTVDYAAIALTGDEANNYSLTNTTASSTGTIDKKSVTATFADISKIYDGTTNATPGAGTLTGVIAADEGKVNVSATDASYDEKNAGSRTVNYTGVTLSGAEAGNYSIATTATGNGTIGRKALELVADPASTQYGDYIPATFTGSVTGFVAGEGIGVGDTLLFAMSDPSASAVGSYGITGTINGSSSGDYGLNYTFTNAASNANAFTIYARPASVQDMVLSDIIPGIKGMTGANISVTALDNSLEQATDKKAEVGIEFAVAQTILSVDADRNLSLENRGMKQPPAMTPQEVAEQVHAQQGKGNGVAAQASGNAGAASGGTNENGAASNAGVTSAVNAAMDVVQQTDDAVGTEESKRKKGVA